jgi:hypothetical protein
MAGWLQKTAMWLDVRKIIENGANPVKFNILGMLHTEAEDSPILKILSVDIVRNYIANIGDYVYIEFSMGLGDYTSKLFPYRNNLEFSLKKILLEDVSHRKQTDSVISVERYKAIFLTKHNQQINATSYETHSHSALNLTDVITVKLQLLNRSLEPLRIKQVNGVYRQTTQQQLIHSMMASESNKILIDGKPAIDGVDIVEPDNSKTMQHVIIPDGTNLTSIPSYLQEKMGGVYNSDIGNYLQTFNGKKIWFIYPLYNVKRFKTNVKKVIFYCIPVTEFPGHDRSYKMEGDILHIMVTGERVYDDSADVDYMNHGSGFRMADANSFMKKPAEMTPDGPIAKRSNLNYEVVGHQRKDGLNYAPVTKNVVSSNVYAEFSKVNSRSIAKAQLIWEHANPDLLYPCMPCKFIYLVKDKQIELEGIIAQVHVFSQLTGMGVSAGQHVTQCHITLFIEITPYVPDAKNLPNTYGGF